MKKEESGMALLTVVLFATVAAVLAAALFFASQAQVSSVRRHIRVEKAFFIAEAGVERAKAELRQIKGGFNGVLLGADGIPNTADDGVLSFGPSVSFGGGEYSVRISDNADDPNPDPFVDTDRTLVIWSTGTFQNISRVLEVCVRLVESVAPPLNADGSVMIYGEDNEIALKGSAMIDGRDYSVPEDFHCSGAGCLGTVIATNPATAGVFTTSESTLVTNSHPSLILGDPPVSTGAVASLDRQYWVDMVAELIPLASIEVPSGVIAGNQTLGTRENPVVTYVSGNSKFSGNVDGAGIMIVEGEVEIDTTGTFHYEGIIIFVGADNKFNDRGTASIFGSVVSLGASLDMKPHGSPQIMYSTEALANLSNLSLPPGPLSVVYWRQVK